MRRFNLVGDALERKQEREGFRWRATSLGKALGG
jgi:hypothetical protein